MQVAILAGGLATRMRPRTLTTPKSMLDVAGRPFIAHQLELLARCGYGDVLLCIGHLGEQIRGYVEGGAKFGVRVRYAVEGKELLGTAGALRAAKDLLEPTFLVTYGDSYLPFDYSAPLRMLHENDDCDGVMAVWANQGKFDASNVSTDGAWVLRYEKGSADPALDHIDYGATALRKEALLASDARGLDEIQHALAEAGRMRACVAKERFYEIGSPSGLETLERHLSSLVGAPS